VELIFSSADWVEIVVAIDLVLEPIAGTLVKSEFLARNAAHNGDPVTPLVLAAERADARRHLDGATALIAQACADAEHAARNRALVRGWLEQWTSRTERAAKALEGLFRLDGIAVEPFAPCLERARARQRSALQKLGF